MSTPIEHHLLTDADLAEKIGGGVTAEQVAIWRRTYGWPFTRFGRQARYSNEQVAAILRMQAEAGGKATPRVAIAGQTKRSARRAS